MDKKLSKSLYLLSENSRITTKELSKKTRTSQQSASYLVNRLKHKKVIKKYTTIVDPVKLGFTNILVGINFLVFDRQKQKEIVAELKKNDHIVAILEAGTGLDLLLEYCAYNLSRFNKIHSEITDKYYESLETRFIYPVVVKHRYPKSYLINKTTDTSIILSGDREAKDLTKREEAVLTELVKEPDITFTKLSQKTKSSIKTVVDTKRRLEKRKLIRGYTATLDLGKVGITKQIILLNLTGPNEIDKVVAHALLNRNVVELIKLIGPYQIMIVTESVSEIKMLRELRSLFQVKEYRIIDIEDTIKDKYIPENL